MKRFLFFFLLLSPLYEFISEAFHRVTAVFQQVALTKPNIGYTQGETLKSSNINVALI
jgi:hypothetical protein